MRTAIFVLALALTFLGTVFAIMTSTSRRRTSELRDAVEDNSLELERDLRREALLISHGNAHTS